MENRNLKEVVDNEYKEFALYTVENRAIPSCIDGLKPVQRKVLYAMINEHKGRKTKVAELGSIAKFGYHHGENSAMQAAIGMTASYNNNVPLFTADGNFGTRLIPEASAPRYIFALKSDAFDKFFTDFEVCDSRDSVDDPEPQTYLPLIPWVLVNGIQGIAVGFATKIMPHSPKDLIKACLAVLKVKKQPALIPSFPEFTGDVEVVAHDKYIIKGRVERIKRNTWEITEVPYGQDREAIYNTLTELEVDGKIQSFEDACDKKGFRFIIKLDTASDTKCSEDPIVFFKLQQKVTENYTTLDEKGQLKIFNNKQQIVEYFVDYRLNKVMQKLNFDLAKLQEQLRWLTMKIHFIQHVCDRNINFRTQKKEYWKTYFQKELLVHKPEPFEIDKLLAIQLIDMTEDSVEIFEQICVDLRVKIDKLEDTVPRDHYIEQLEKLLKSI